MKSVSVQVQTDHLQKLARARKPVLALAEMVWNALDADADDVRVEFDKNEIGGIEEIRVIDDGHGIAYDEAEDAFAKLGGSWKRTAGQSRSQHRLLHGKDGKGRFRAFALGDRVQWETKAAGESGTISFSVSTSVSDLGTFNIGDPEEASGEESGTTVSISNLPKPFGSLTSDRALLDFGAIFALYLRQYPAVRLTYDGQRVTTRDLESHTADYPIPEIELDDGSNVSAHVAVVEWAVPMDRAMFLCDEDGFALSEIAAGIQAPGFHFTAYLKASYFRDLEDENVLDVADMHPGVQKLVGAARDCLRGHFRRRAAELAADVVEEWKREEVYPYAGEPSTVIERAEREVFEVVALNVNSYLPSFRELDARSKKFSLRLLKESLEESPEAVQRIVQDVLDLPKEKQDELAKLLQKTTLSAIISASKLVADRLDFLRGLEVLVFDPESKQQILERRQLHRIVADETWIFGEEYALAVDDESLTEVLRKHLSATGREVEVFDPVVREDGTKGIIDLMFSRTIPQPRAKEHEHLVVELKRPKVSIDDEALTQLKSYAFAVADDERFRDTETRWTFWAISNEMSDFARHEASQSGRPFGLVFDDDKRRIRIWVKTWAQVIDECRARLQFFREKLEYSADRQSGLDYLRRVHASLLPEVVTQMADEVEDAD